MYVLITIKLFFTQSFFFFFFFFLATPGAYGFFQAWGWIYTPALAKVIQLCLFRATPVTYGCYQARG